MGSNEIGVTVLGKYRFDLFTFKDEENNYLQRLQAGPELLCKFLSDLNQPCYLEDTDGPNDTATTDIPFSLIGLSAISKKYEVSYQQPQEPLFTINEGPIPIKVDFPTRSSTYSKGKQKEANVLVIDDPDGDLLETNPNIQRKASFVFYQTRRPEKLLKTSYSPALLSILRNDGLEKFVVVLDAEDLRANEIPISQYSWEKAAADTVRNFNPNQRIKDAISVAEQTNLKWIKLIIRFSHVGAVVLQTDINPPGQRNGVYFDSSKGEGEFIERYSLHQTALEAAFLSGLVSAMISDINDDEKVTKTAIKRGLSCTRQLSNEGIVPVPEINHSIQYPKLKPEFDFPFQPSIIPPSNQLGRWSILRHFCDENGTGDNTIQKMTKYGKDIVKKGMKDNLPAVPRAEFGSFITADRSEIEDFHRISKEVEKYLKEAEKYYIISEGKEDLNRALIQPLSIAVFGAPGSGKSFIVKQIIEGVREKMSTPKNLEKYPLLEYNLSQFIDYSNLLFAFQEVRDKTVSGQIPIVIFDEFDTTLNGELGWLKFFLAPMQDGKFFDQGKIRPIGHAVFIFIGGTRSTYARFQSDKIQLVNAGTIDSSATGNTKPTKTFQGHSRRRSSVPGYHEEKAERAERAVKKPDFVSRLQDHLDIRGYDKPSGNDPDPKYIIRRAILIHSKLKQMTKKEIELDDSVLVDLLNAERYTHGARSIDNIFKGSTIKGGKLRVNLNPSEIVPPPGRSRKDGVPPDQGPRQNGAPPSQGPHQNGVPPDQGPRQNGAPPSQGPRQNGAPPSQGPRQNGVSPDQGSRQNGAPPSQGPRQNGVPPDQGPRQNGVPPDQGPRQNGVPPGQGTLREWGSSWPRPPPEWGSFWPRPPPEWGSSWPRPPPEWGSFWSRPPPEWGSSSPRPPPEWGFSWPRPPLG